MRCPVCGDKYVQDSGKEDGVGSIGFPNIYYGADKVCIMPKVVGSGFEWYAHGEPL